METLELKLLGPVRIRRQPGASEIALRSRAARALLVYLAVHRPRRFTREHLAALLWPENKSLEHSRHRLRQALFILRRELERPEVPLLVLSGDEICLDPANIVVDVWALEALANGHTDPPATAGLITLYEGELAEDLQLRSADFSDWLRDERTRLHDLACRTLGRAADAKQAEGKLEEAIDINRRLIFLDRYGDEAHRSMMRRLAAAGRRGAALQVYRDFVETLRHPDYRLQPEPETVRLYKDIGAPPREPAAAVAGDPRPPTAIFERLPPPDKPSIVVLPFRNIGDDPAESYFADGITENISFGLGRFKEFFVISHSSAFAFRELSPDLAKVAGQLGVRYILSGTVQKNEAGPGGAPAPRVRITAELTEALIGRQIWAERYDRELRNVLALQDEIANSLIAAVFPQFFSAEIRRVHRKDPQSLDAWDLMLRARERLWRFTRKDNQAAQSLLQQALTREPDYAQAAADLAGTYLLDSLYNWGSAPAQALKQAWDHAHQAAELDPDNPWTYAILGLVLACIRQHADGIRQLETAIELNPNLALAHGFLGLALAFNGDTKRAVDSTAGAIRLGPRDPFMTIWYVALSAAAFVNGHYDEAADWARRSIRERIDLPSGHRLLAASLGMLGQIEDSRRAVKDVLRLIPDQTQSNLRFQLPYRDPNVNENYIKGLAVGGLPE